MNSSLTHQVVASNGWNAWSDSWIVTSVWSCIFPDFILNVFAELTHSNSLQNSVKISDKIALNFGRDISKKMAKLLWRNQESYLSLLLQMVCACGSHVVFISLAMWITFSPFDLDSWHGMDEVSLGQSPANMAVKVSSMTMFDRHMCIGQPFHPCAIFSSFFLHDLERNFQPFFHDHLLHESLQNKWQLRKYKIINSKIRPP